MNIIEELAQRYKREERTIPTPQEIAEKRVNEYNSSTGNLNKADGFNCNICNNRGYIAYVDKSGYEAHEPCKCQNTREILRLAKKSGLGDVLNKFRFDTYETKEKWQERIKTLAQNFCKDESAKFFYIGGQVGCGKTHLCTAISAYYIKRQKEVKYLMWQDTAVKLKAIVNDKQYTSEIKGFKSAEVLYIDDLFKVKSGEQPTPADIKLAYEIINYRLMNDKGVTIISSEHTSEELLNYDEALGSRIVQQAGKYCIDVQKDIKRNYRLKERKVL